MIVLYQFPRCWQIPNPSHFCVKLETYLRMADLEYRMIPTIPFTAPRGKLPYIDDNGVKIADSRAIIRHLQQHYGPGPDTGLSPAQLAQALAWQRLLEEHLYWISMYSRWQGSAENWQINKQAIFGSLPVWAGAPLAQAYRWRIKAQLRGQGLARLSPAEIWQQATADIAALSTQLGDQPYFLGQQPCSLDASAYGVLSNIINCPVTSPLQELAEQTPNLPAFCRRMQSRYFPELSA